MEYFQLPSSNTPLLKGTKGITKETKKNNSFTHSLLGKQHKKRKEKGKKQSQQKKNKKNPNHRWVVNLAWFGFCWR